MDTLAEGATPGHDRDLETSKIFLEKAPNRLSAVPDMVKFSRSGAGIEVTRFR